MSMITTPSRGLLYFAGQVDPAQKLPSVFCLDSLCVCVCVHACVRACIRACVHMFFS